MARINSWIPIVNKFNKRLSRWKSSLLSIGGRSTLITSVLGSLGIYFLSIFPMPIQVNKTLEKIRSNFFWGNTEEAVKIPWIAWKSVVSPKPQGGLGIGSLNAFNLALIQKWRWRFAHEHHSLWTRVITDIHGHSGDLGSYFFSQCSGTGVWARIVRSINSLNEKGIIPFSTLKRKVNDGTGTKFWHDSWICDTPLAIKYPRLFRLEINQDCLVRDKWNGEWIWSWSRPITGGTIGSHFEELQNLVSNVQLGDARDEWQWSVLNQKIFSVKHTRHHIDHHILPSEAPATRWCKFIPKKVNILVWRILRNRIPSRWNLSRKGVELSSLACPICSKHPETSHHLFWTCDLASAIWNLTFKWVDLFPNAASSLTEVFSWLDNMNIRASRKLVLESIIGVFVWVIWKYRNQLVFGKKDWHRKDLFDHIISYSFLWFSSRSRKIHVSWNQWIQNPLLDNAL